MSVCLQDVIKDIEIFSKDGIEVNGEKFEVDFYLGADWNSWPQSVELNHRTALMHVYGAHARKIKGMMVKRSGRLLMFLREHVQLS